MGRRVPSQRPASMPAPRPQSRQSVQRSNEKKRNYPFGTRTSSQHPGAYGTVHAEPAESARHTDALLVTQSSSALSEN